MPALQRATSPRPIWTARRRALAVGSCLAALALGAAAAETDASRLPLAVQKLLDCRAVADNAGRLACYDASVAELGRLISAGEIVVVDHERVAKVKRQAFGFSLPSLSLFERGERAGEKGGELQQISGNVASGYQRGDGKWIIELEDGGLWEQTDNEKLPVGAHKGSRAEVRKAALGSFFMNIDGQRALRVRRVR